MVVGFVLWAFFCVAQILSILLFLCVCETVSEGGEEGTSGFNLGAQDVLQVTPFHIRLAPDMLESVFVRRRWNNATLLSIYPRLYLCSCAHFCALEKGIVPWEGLGSLTLQYKFNRKVQAGHSVWFCGLKACHFWRSWILEPGTVVLVLLS